MVNAANEKYVAMGEAAHLQAEELALAINEQLRRAMDTGDSRMRVTWPGSRSACGARSPASSRYPASKRSESAAA